MRLVGIARIHGELRQTWRSSSAGGKTEESLEAKHGLKCFWTVPDGGREATPELAAAASEPRAELRNSAVGMIGKPADGGANCVIHRARVSETFEQG